MMTSMFGYNSIFDSPIFVGHLNEKSLMSVLFSVLFLLAFTCCSVYMYEYVEDTKFWFLLNGIVVSYLIFLLFLLESLYLENVVQTLFLALKSFDNLRGGWGFQKYIFGLIIIKDITSIQDRSHKNKRHVVPYHWRLKEKATLTRYYII